MIDGTHIDVTILKSIVAQFRGRKDRPTQNVLDIVTSNKQFVMLWLVGKDLLGTRSIPIMNYHGYDP